jgi:hypothetical protein
LRVHAAVLAICSPSVFARLEVAAFFAANLRAGLFFPPSLPSPQFVT